MTHKYREEGIYTVSLTVEEPFAQDTKTMANLIRVGKERLYLPSVLAK